MSVSPSRRFAFRSFCLSCNCINDRNSLLPHARLYSVSNDKQYTNGNLGPAACCPKQPRQAVGSPETGDVNAGDPDYAPITLTQSETDDEMQDLWDYAQPSPDSPITVSDEDCDKEQDPSLGPCTARLERISLGADSDARGHIEAKKKRKHQRRGLSNMQDVPKRSVLLAELIDGWRIVWRQNPLWTQKYS